jgi:hypothetical protein
VGLDGVPRLMGRLWSRTRKNKESAAFEYDKTWLENSRLSSCPSVAALFELGAKDLLNSRMAYVGVSRGRYDAQIYTVST